MTQVDHEDDAIRRWVIYHYRFDPARRERRHVVLAAYDSESQFRAEFDRLAAGDRSDRENLTGAVLEPGHLAAAARGHRVRRATEHDVNPEPLLNDGPVPLNMSILGVIDDATLGTDDD